MHQAYANSRTLQRLTALWALGESGLGGWMHALKLPFTGIFVGGFAVVMISLLAYYSGNHYRSIVRALLLVLLIKFLASPQSPPQAYLAVAFQGVCGALLFSLLRNFRLASLLFAVIAMLESALQKLIVLMVLFGNSLWQAINMFFDSVVKDFSLAGHSFSFWLIVLYICIYVIFGLCLGWWVGTLPYKIVKHKQMVAESIGGISEQHLLQPAAASSTRFSKIIIYLFAMMLVLLIFAAGGLMGKVVYTLLRTVTIIFVFFAIINPLIRLLLRKRLEKGVAKNKNALNNILAILPEIRMNIAPAYKLAGIHHKGWKRYPAFILILVIIAINPGLNAK